MYEISVNAYSKFNVHPNAKEAIEICLLRMLAFNPLLKIDDNESPSEPEKKNLKNLWVCCYFVVIELCVVRLQGPVLEECPS